MMTLFGERSKVLCGSPAKQEMSVRTHPAETVSLREKVGGRCSRLQLGNRVRSVVLPRLIYKSRTISIRVIIWL